MGIKTMISKVQFNLKKAAPDILIGVGVVTSVAAIVGFCKQSHKAVPVIDTYADNVDKIRCAHEDAIQPGALVTYDERSYRKDLIEETLRTAGKLGSIYIVPITLEVVSIGCFIGSHGIMKDENMAMTAAYAGIAGELKNLHERIVERYGKDVDRELTHGISVNEVDEVYTNPDTGEETKLRKLVTEVSNDPNHYSAYARYYDESCPGWCDDAGRNLIWLRGIEETANARLRLQGYLFLNDVYDMVGIERTKAGQIVGWTYVSNGKNPYGDNYISFGLDNYEKSGVRDFVNGLTPYVLLDFNVDGRILDSLPR